VRFSLHLVPDDLNLIAKRTKFAEENGFDQVWIAESHLTCRDHNVALAVAILNTKKIPLGPGVTNPILHDNSVTASAIATLDEVSGGRAFLGVGSGDSAIYNLGQRLTSLETLRRTLVTLKALMRGEPVEFEGRSIHARWIKKPVPLWISAEGPKTLELAGELCDGVIVGTGLTPEVIEDSLACLARGARRSGRRSCSTAAKNASMSTCRILRPIPAQWSNLRCARTSFPPMVASTTASVFVRAAWSSAGDQANSAAMTRGGAAPTVRR